MTPRNLGNVHTTRNSCRNTSMRDMVLSLRRYFYLLMEKSVSCYTQVWSPYYQVTQCNKKTRISASSRGQVRSEYKHQHYSQLPPPFISLNKSQLINDLDSVSTNPVEKDGVVHDAIKYLPHKVFLLWHHQ